MSFRSAREARERFLQLARRAEESAPLFERVHESAGALNKDTAARESMLSSFHTFSNIAEAGGGVGR